jgi:zinc D-Ala-D-Ala dipeptidase
MMTPISIIPRRAMLGGLLCAPLIGCKAVNVADVTSPVVPVRALEQAGLVELIKRDPTIRLDLRYATTNNFTGRVLYRQARAFLQVVAADALVRAHRRAQADGLGLTIFDAYRPWAVTKALWDATAPAQRDFVANPAKGSRHNRGCAVDLTLHDRATGALLEMPSTFDHFGASAHRNYAGASPAAAANRARLADYMEAEGFIGLSNEWWHFDYRDWANYPVLDVAFEALT